MEDKTDQTERYQFTAAKLLAFVAALQAADELIADHIEGAKPIAARVENYLLQMHHAMGPENHGLLIRGFLEELEEQLLDDEDNPAELLTLGTAKGKPKARKPTPEAKH